MIRKKIRILSPIVLVITSIAGTLTFILTLIGNGLNERFLSVWIRSFIPTALFMAPTAILATFLLSRVVEKLFNKQTELQKKIILAIMMGCTIEFFVSLVTTANSTGLLSQIGLMHWITLYIRSIPIGICVGLLMSFIIKPWMNTRIARLEQVA